MRTVRIPHPVDLVPGAQEALNALQSSIKGVLSDLSDGEVAARALSEAVSNPDDETDPVPDRIWDQAAKHFDQKELAALLLSAVLTNAVDRLSTATRQSKGRS
ncbi:carboxymuconolactone decarboxylase family protein [Actinoplanes sp. NPDC051513]|uniref:carboxymuconolactone decarboxylase family protein n=1 Tax=Actinoplanes sp. NPDC051513 TaxID=3363908 RepID=UPI00378796E8